jgi:hypothetical protein
MALKPHSNINLFLARFAITVLTNWRGTTRASCAPGRCAVETDSRAPDQIMHSFH